MRFESKYSCPVGMVAGGGNGRFGICGMEVVSVLTGSYIDNQPKWMKASNIPPYPRATVPSVDQVLGNLIIDVNDSCRDSISQEQRANGLWPILPKVLDSAQAVSNKGLGVPANDLDAYVQAYLKQFPVNRLAVILGFPKDTHMGPGGLIRGYASFGKTPNELWDRALTALKFAVEIFWEHHKATPREDFTEDEMNRLYEYLSANEGNIYLQRRDLIPA